VLERHSERVSSVAFSPDGAHIVSSSYDRTERVWDAHTGKELAMIDSYSSLVRSVAFSPDGAHIVLGSDDRTVRLWDCQTGKELAVLEGHSNYVRSVAFSPDGAHIVSGSDDKTVRMWNAHTGKELAVFEGHSGWVRSVAFSPDGAHITSSDIYRHELVWSVKGTVHILKQCQAETLTYKCADLCVAEVAQTLTSAITHASHTHAEALVWEGKTGWISWRSSNGSCLPLCWMPVERRGYTFACRGTTAVIGARTGVVTILDFSDVIATLGIADRALPPSHPEEPCPSAHRDVLA
jgi:WD40 repeat protein